MKFCMALLGMMVASSTSFAGMFCHEWTCGEMQAMLMKNHHLKVIDEGQAVTVFQKGYRPRCISNVPGKAGEWVPYQVMAADDTVCRIGYMCTYEDGPRSCDGAVGSGAIPCN